MLTRSTLFWRRFSGVLLATLSGCASIQAPAPQPTTLYLTQAINIPDGSTHASFTNGERGMGKRYTPYCRLDLHAPLAGVKKLEPASYTITRIAQHYVEDDISEMPVHLWRRMGHHPWIAGGTRGMHWGWNSTFMDDEPMFSMLRIHLAPSDSDKLDDGNETLGDARVKRLSCFKEHGGYFEARPFSMAEFQQAVGKTLMLSK